MSIEQSEEKDTFLILKTCSESKFILAADHCAPVKCEKYMSLLWESTSETFQITQLSTYFIFKLIKKRLSQKWVIGKIFQLKGA